MPEINPLTNNQIFLKKIAENTGSNYESGDVSEINPLTIDQIFLKEIAANTAGQSGDITELEGKVADNADAIEAMVNVNGCCNVMPNNASTTTQHGATFTVNADKTVTIERVTPDGVWVMLKLSDNVLIKAGTYTLTSLYNGSEKDDVYLVITDMSDVTLAKTEGVESVEYTFASDTAVRFYITIKPNAAISTPITFKPMLYDARLNPTGYASYSMTNSELTKIAPFVYQAHYTNVGVGSGGYVLVDKVSELPAPYNSYKLLGLYLSGGSWDYTKNVTLSLGDNQDDVYIFGEPQQLLHLYIIYVMSKS